MYKNSVNNGINHLPPTSIRRNLSGFDQHIWVMKKRRVSIWVERIPVIFVHLKKLKGQVFDEVFFLGGGNSNIFIFTPKIGEDDPIWLIFSEGACAALALIAFAEELIWLIFFRTVETTNQFLFLHFFCFGPAWLSDYSLSVFGNLQVLPKLEDVWEVLYLVGLVLVVSFHG